jgi:hypothetical protein
VLVHSYGVDADEAVDMLRVGARENRMRVRLLTERIVNDPRLAQDLWG